jgi:ABC-type iron transport system FetAB ATPase subunit
VPQKSRGIVIDASIAKAAGRSEHPTSSTSRVFLEEIRRICHSLVLSDDLMLEWKHRASFLAREWLASMFARKKVKRLRLVPDKTFKERISTTTGSDKERAAMLKDLHLIEAAIHISAPVASLDETVRALFHHASQHVLGLRAVVWVNLSKEQETALVWLENGAPNEAARCLGFGLSA